jgi:hypothetical protein
MPVNVNEVIENLGPARRKKVEERAAEARTPEARSHFCPEAGRRIVIHA